MDKITHFVNVLLQVADDLIPGGLVLGGEWARKVLFQDLADRDVVVLMEEVIEKDDGVQIDWELTGKPNFTGLGVPVIQLQVLVFRVYLKQLDNDLLLSDIVPVQNRVQVGL